MFDKETWQYLSWWNNILYQNIQSNKKFIYGKELSYVVTSQD